jgi:cysteine desulfurase / selenocysteine lyase
MIYFDNAQASLPKPKSVLRAVNDMMKNLCVNPDKEGHALERTCFERFMKARENAASFFGIEEESRLTLSTQYALAIILQELVKSGDHVITTVYEKNHIVTPLSELSKRGARVTVLDGNLKGEISLSSLKKSINPSTRLIIMSLVDSVTGSLLPVEEIGRICRERGILFLVDGGIGPGLVPIDLELMNIDIFSFEGFKYLYGPPGIGGLYVGERVEALQWRADIHQSEIPNMPALWGLNAGIDFIRKKDINKIKKQMEELLLPLVEGLSEIKGARLLMGDIKNRVPIISFLLKGKNSKEVAQILDKKYEIAVSGGFYKSDLFHSISQNLSSGSIRISPGFFNEKEDAEKLVKAVWEITR